MATEGTSSNLIENDGQTMERMKRVSALLADKNLRDLLIQKLSDDGHVPKGTTWNNVEIATGRSPSGSAHCSAVPPQFPFMPFPAAPFWGPFHTSPVSGAGMSNPPELSRQVLQGSTHLSGQPGSSRSQDQGEDDQPGSSRAQGQDDKADEDFVDLLDEEESLELVQFDPTVPNENAWEAGEKIDSFIEKHFNHTITAEERDAIMKDFPKPSCTALCAPKLDEDIKKQIRMAGKDPHFGVEKHLFKLQEQILDMAGPLTCLWADLLNPEATVMPEDIILLLQRVLVLLGSASYNVTQERRRVALSRVNPAINSLPDDKEEEKDKGKTLFGGGFLEKATKRIEEEKALAKVAGAGRKPPPPAKRRRLDNKDPNDLRRFLEKGAPARYGGRNTGRRQPYFQKGSTKGKSNSNASRRQWTKNN